MEQYDFRTIEKKWQKKWEEEKTFQVENFTPGEKDYLLIEFPYPSGEGLHIGHPRPYTGIDIIARKRRLEGRVVLFPIGFDSFGLPTENYAIKHKIHPQIVTERNVERFTQQLKMLGLSFDWDRCVLTSDPSYYKWTQWIFLQLYKHGLAYKAKMDINFCPSCKVGLANEEVVGGECERCHTPVIRRAKEQWMLEITKYAQRLLDDLDTVDFAERIKAQQRNWIGRSEGATIRFPVIDTQEHLEVYTTRPDTVYGATYMVIAPEHPLIEKYATRIKNMEELEAYRHEAKHKSDFERMELVKDKTGVRIEGLDALNPISEEVLPIYISDYVMMEYGSGAIMAVPAHDERDYEFAQVFHLPIHEVVSGGDVTREAYTGDGTIVGSPLINGLSVPEAIEKMTAILEERGLGERKVQFKLRDWVFSRQRYWGEPIPIVHCPKCGTVPLDESELPLLLPEVQVYEPTEDGSSPLAAITDWVETSCPTCGGPAQRETDTMPQWAGSSWYFLRYLDPHNDEALASREAIEYWMPVDWYNGGMEHTTLHLLYSRFWHKFLYDIGVVNTVEPYAKRTSHGFILGKGNIKMSKSRGNVINPDEVIEEVGADALRGYEMFVGDFEKAVSWSDEGLCGTKRLSDRLWFASDRVDKNKRGYSPELEVQINRTIKKVGEDYESLKANTAIAAMMALLNEYYHQDSIRRDEYEVLLTLLNPVAPHITEELNEMLGNPPITEGSWPTYDPEKTLEDVIEVPVQINGKVRFRLDVERGSDEAAIDELLEASEAYHRQLEGKTLIKRIYIQDKLISLVVK